MELLDNPHPLDMLSEVTSYGPDGGISRYHNPDNYTKALGGVLRARKKAWRPLLSGRSLADAKGAQQSAPGLEGSLGMATSGLWFNPRTGTQKVHSFRIYALLANMTYEGFHAWLSPEARMRILLATALSLQVPGMFFLKHLLKGMLRCTGQGQESRDRLEASER